ncbi:MAG TPA: Holliday junction resolvase-like protein [Gemmatimonadales bacterium]|nr:Holliday junction resolvase-like protein [Gemmatimonadales bacterium]
MRLSTALLIALVAGLALVLGFLLWKARYTRAVRQDVLQRSLAVTAGKVFEQLVPYLPDFPFNPKDVRFLGSPVDLVVFDGLSDGAVSRVVFVEVKTGDAELSTRERRVRDAVLAHHVEWHELRLP